MLYVRARGAATPRVAPHRPGPAPPHAAGMLISSGHSSTSVESAIASLQLGAAEMRRWWRAGAGPGLLGLERWNKTTILLETVRSFTAREKPRQESRAGREAASQAAPPPPPPRRVQPRTLIGHNVRIMLLLLHRSTSNSIWLWDVGASARRLYP